MEPILQIKNLTHTYGIGTPFQRSAVEDMSFDVYDGEFLGIIGHTGSGKSTLIQHLNGLLKPTSGQVLLRGKDIWAEPKKIRDVRFQVGLVFQYPEYQLFEETVYKDIAFGPTNMGKRGEELDRCVREAARLVGIRDDQLEKSPFELSGGQKRRVALAGVIAMEPKVLVLDEPTAGLDPAGRENLMANIRDYHRNKQTTVILVSHSMDEIAQNVDRILVLKSAHVLMSGAPAEVFARGQELLAAGLDVPQVTRIAMALRDRGLAIDPAVYTVRDLERQLLALRKGGEGRHAEGYYPGPVFPWRHRGPQAGPPHENFAGGTVYRRAILCQRRGGLCSFGLVPGGLRPHFPGGSQGPGPGIEAGAVHHHFHRHFEPVFHAWGPLPPGVGLFEGL